MDPVASQRVHRASNAETNEQQPDHAWQAWPYHDGVPEPDDEVLRVAESFSDIARVLAAAPDLQAMFLSVVRLAAATLDAFDHAGISIVEGRSVTSPAATGETPARVDSIQTEENEGPCLDAIRQHELIQIDDVAAESRWPAFTRRVLAETDVRSILSVRLYLDEHTIGCVNLYASAPHAFDEHDIALAVVFAAHAAVALDAGQLQQNLEAKAASREAIGRAKGILMAHRGADRRRGLRPPASSLPARERQARRHRHPDQRPAHQGLKVGALTARSRWLALAAIILTGVGVWTRRGAVAGPAVPIGRVTRIAGGRRVFTDVGVDVRPFAGARRLVAVAGAAHDHGRTEPDDEGRPSSTSAGHAVASPRRGGSQTPSVRRRRRWDRAH